jgi:hypothetical protein
MTESTKCASVNVKFYENVNKIIAAEIGSSRHIHIPIEKKRTFDQRSISRGGK